MTGTNIKALLTEGKTREAWGTIKRWYHKTKYHPPPPTMEGLDHNSTLREDLYRQRPPEFVPVPIIVQQVEIPDKLSVRGGYISVSTGPAHGEIRRSSRDEGISPAGVAKGIETGKGISHRTVGDTGKFEKLEFQEGRLPVDLTWEVMVLLPKWGGEYIGIGLV